MATDSMDGYVDGPPRRGRARWWYLLGWLNVLYCLLAFLAILLFAGLYVAFGRMMPLEVDWSYVPVSLRPSLWLSLTFPLWFPLAVFILTVLSAFGCFRRFRGLGGFVLSLSSVLMLALCAILVGAMLHLNCVGSVRSGPSSTISFQLGNDYYLFVIAAVLLLPSAVALIVALTAKREPPTHTN